MNQGLCEPCRGLFNLEQLRNVSGGCYRHSQVKTIIGSFLDGCPFCEFVYHVMLYDHVESSLHERIMQMKKPRNRSLLLEYEGDGDSDDCYNSETGEYMRFKMNGGCWVVVHVQSKTEKSLVDGLEIEVEGLYGNWGLCRAYTAQDDPCSELTSFRPFETDVTSPTVIAAARQLIASCQDSHLDCHDKVDAQPPSRIIDVGKIKVNEVGVGEVDAGKWPCVKLRNTRDLELKDYVALSYCWGGEQPMKLLSTNRAKYEDCVLLAELPKTLQDAVECTRALGYRYLWVDALCIMQDVQSEKLKEIGNMASIYRNAAVTIIAAVARSVNEGYLNYDRLSSIQSKFGFKESKPINCHIEVELNNGQIGTLVIIPEIVWDDPKTMPINERGWCLQESVLPRRLLYYGPEELLFRCHTIDCQPMTPSVIDYTKGINPPRILSHQQRGSNPKSLWHDFVLDFSERKVSVPADRTYAITGIIEELQWRWDDECIWGIWKSRLLEDLCWKRREGTSVRTQHAPCWSWMSFNGGIVEVNHRPFEHVDAIFHGIAGKELHLTCRVMTNIMIKFHKRYFERCQADVEITEADTNEINYLYIGSTKQEEWSDSVDIAIAAIELEKGVFRREGLLQIGIPEYGGTAEFMEPEPTKITLI